jgi:glycosyltransferase involved in cell wall biosynthesis
VPHSELGQYYERAAVVCVPSRWEGYGFVAHEAMAHGRPVVATRVGGLVDAIEDGVTGVIVDSGDNVQALRRAVERLLANPRQRHSLGTAARERAIGLGRGERGAQLLGEAYEWALRH